MSKLVGIYIKVKPELKKQLVDYSNETGISITKIIKNGIKTIIDGE